MNLLLRTAISRAASGNRLLLTQLCRNVSRQSVTTTATTFRLRKPSETRIDAHRSMSAAAHDHSKIWVLEKAVSVGLLAVIPAAFVCQNSALDYALALSLVAHSHWGFEAIVVDYIRPSLFGAAIPKLALASLYLVSIAALAGLFYLNYSDVGLSTAIRMLAKI